MPNETTAVERTFHALADPTRRAIVERLGHGPASVTMLAEPFAMALPSFLQHIHVLERSQLVATTKRGRVRTCELRPEALQPAQDWLAAQRTRWEQRLDRLDAFLKSTMEETHDQPRRRVRP
jgi:DNA-binding transcriptional ArsR family regulator